MCRSVAATVGNNGGRSPFAATSTAANSFSAAACLGSPVGAAALAAALASAGLPTDGTEQGSDSGAFN